MGQCCFLLYTSEGGYMINQNSPNESVIGPNADLLYLCLHGHFYQPPREDPFTGMIPREPGATPYANYNEKITVEQQT